MEMIVDILQNYGVWALVLIALIYFILRCDITIKYRSKL